MAKANHASTSSSDQNNNTFFYREIKTQGPLCRFTSFNPPLTFNGFRIWSIQHCFAACLLAQHGLFGDIVQLLRIQRQDQALAIMRDAEAILEQRGLKLSTDWIIAQAPVMEQIVREVANSDPNHFSERLCEIQREIVPELKGHSLDAVDILFFATGQNIRERIWTSGYRPGRIPPEPRDCPGANLFGRIVTRVFKEGLIRSEFDAIPCLEFTVSDLLTKHVIPPQMYQKTVALISDSTFRQAECVQNGDIFYESGATWGRLADLLLQNHVALTDYGMLIICAGTNDAMKLDKREWKRSWDKFKALLLPLRNQSRIAVAINSGVGAPEWKNLIEYEFWFWQEYNRDFEKAPNFMYNDWVTKPPDNNINFFFGPDGRKAGRVGKDGKFVCKYFDFVDGKHPNGAALRKMWKFWGKDCWGSPWSILRSIDFISTGDASTTRRLYPAVTLSQRLEGVRD